MTRRPCGWRFLLRFEFEPRLTRNFTQHSVNFVKDDSLQNEPPFIC